MTVANPDKFFISDPVATDEFTVDHVMRTIMDALEFGVVGTNAKFRTSSDFDAGTTRVIIYEEL